ncbi:hypothetical protein BGZ82_001170 [Podila clonocystis]|nr:hypothetical protein BGZ82_001170 [Podila clonocystis]
MTTQYPLGSDLNKPSNDGHYGFGYIPTPREKYRNYASIAPADPAKVYPSKIDLISKMSDVQDQRGYESCVGFAICAALEIVPSSVGKPQDESERFIWYHSKRIDGDRNPPDVNRGTYIDSALAVVQLLGSCWEKVCEYKDAPLAAPSPEAELYASRMKARKVFRLNDNKLNDYKDLLSKGWPVIVGFDIFGDGEYLWGTYAKKTGIMTMPTSIQLSEGRQGGHTVLFVGYDDTAQRIKFKNSWGTDYGEDGYFYMPYDYLQWTYDAWVVYEQEIQLPIPVPDTDGQQLPTPGPTTATDRHLERALMADAKVVGSAASVNPKIFKFGEGKQPRDLYADKLQKDTL